MSRLEVIEASNTKQISDCLKIREEVFINEQGVPEEEELDDLDNLSFHAIAYLDSVPLATGRLINIGDYYFFQPMELNLLNPETLYERMKPIDYKRDKIIYNVNQKKFIRFVNLTLLLTIVAPTSINPASTAWVAVRNEYKPQSL